MAILDIEIDGLTNSIVEIATQQSRSTVIIWWRDLAPLQHRTHHWLFDWQREAKLDRKVAALLVDGQPEVQGLVSFADASDHVVVHLVESAPHDVGAGKKFMGVPGNLFAFACLASIRRGFDGSIAFVSKTELIEHYEKTLGATRLGASQRMIIGEAAARRLVNSYFQEPDQWPN